MEKEFCDLTLACKDKQIQTHKVIILSCSPVLRNILKKNQNPSSTIYLTGVKYEHLQSLVNFMYQGEVNVAEEDLASFLEIAEFLNERGLSKVSREGCDSNMVNFPESIYQSIVPSSNKEKNMKKREVEQSNCHSVSTIVVSIKPYENFIENDKSIISTLAENKFICKKCEKTVFK